MRLITGLLVLLGLAPFALAQGAEEYFARCARLYGQGALDSAQATCELALVSDPEHRPSLRLLARIHLERGELAQAESYLERLGEDPEGVLLRARLLLRKGRPKEVLQLSLPPGPEARLLQALALEKLGRLEAAQLLQSQGLEEPSLRPRGQGELEHLLGPPLAQEKAGAEEDALGVLPQALQVALRLGQLSPLQVDAGQEAEAWAVLGVAHQGQLAGGLGAVQGPLPVKAGAAGEIFLGALGQGEGGKAQEHQKPRNKPHGFQFTLLPLGPGIIPCG